MSQNSMKMGSSFGGYEEQNGKSPVVQYQGNHPPQIYRVRSLTPTVLCSKNNPFALGTEVPIC